MEWLYKWAPIFFGCHCRPERSFFYKGKQFPVCARCTGELTGILAALFTWVFGHPGIICSGILMIPLIVDGMVQFCTSYKSNNFRRFWTGALFGYGLANLFFLSVAGVFHWGYSVGLNLKK